MNAKTMVLLGLKVIALTIILFLCFAVSYSVSGMALPSVGQELATYSTQAVDAADRTLALWIVCASQAAVLIDFGCGRIMTATPGLTDEGWTRLESTARKMEGHTILEKATREFAGRHDVFGSPRADWRVMHRVKAKLDPHNVFAPGRLPGGK